MSGYIGDFPTNAAFHQLVDLWASGVLMELSGATLAAYKDNDATQTTIGVSLADTSHDAISGLHLISIDCADAFYAAGSEISIIVTAGTLEGISQVGRVLFSFSIERTGGALALLKSATFGLAVIEAQTDDIGIAGAGLTAIPTIATVTNVTTVNGLAANVITAASIAAGALTAAKFAAGAFDAVWSVATRLLTAGTNIILAKGVGVTGLNDLDATGVENAVWNGTRASHTTAGSFGQGVASVQGAVTSDVQGKVLGGGGSSITAVGVYADVRALNADSTALLNLAASTDVIYRGTVTSNPTTTSWRDTGLAQTATDHWKGRVAIFRTGTQRYEATVIVGFTPATDEITCTALSVAPAINDTYVIL